MPKSHAKIRDKMDDSYVKVSTDWAAYKRDVAAEEFKDTEHNDDWYTEFTEKYYELCERFITELLDCIRLYKCT